MGAAAAPASAAAGPGVLVSGPGVTRAFVEPAELAAGAEGGKPAAPYTLRVEPGEAGQVISRGGMPVREVIRRAGVDPDAVGYLTVPRPDGSTAYLPGADFAEPPPFPQGPALISVDVDSTRFFRPVTSDPNDVNAEDNIATAAGEALAIGLHDGNVLSVQASASPTSTEAGQAVELSASASGEKPGETISFRWSFGDGASAEGASVGHSFGGSGTYEVRVTAVGSAESGGESAPVAVVVGNPPPAAQPGASPAGAGQPKKKAAAGSSGRGEGAGGGGSGQRGGNGSGSSGGDHGGNGSAPGGESGGAPSTAAEPTPLPSAPPVAETEPEPEPTPSASSEAAAPSAAAKAPSTEQPVAPEAETVEGTLVASSLGPVAAAEAAASRAPGSSSAPGATGSDGATVPLVALIVVALLAAGVLIEWRGTRARSR